MYNKNLLSAMFKEKNRGDIGIFLVVIAIAFGAVMAGGTFFKKGLVAGTDVPTEGGNGSSYACCDSGDGDACKTNPDKKFMWKGTNPQPEEYGLLKSDIALSEGAGHIAEASAPDNLTPSGDRIFLNTTNVTFPNGYPTEYSPGSNNACKIPGQDFVFKKKAGTICQGIPNDEVIYVCKSNCGAGTGVGRFDAYYRIKDVPIPDVIKNCEKPAGTSGASTTTQGKQKLVFPTGEDTTAKRNLQLRTFKVVEEPPPQTDTPWLSPYCKPAIYLYPPQKTDIHVEIAPHGKLTYTDPLYPTSGWDVTANPNGKLTYKNKPYEYLYYEAEVPDTDIKKPDKGFVVAKESLHNFLPDLLTKLGLLENERAEFASYWEKALPASPYYFIGVIDQQNLDDISPLSISPSPDTVLRVTLYFEALDKSISADNPLVVTKQRHGFSVVEWGGIFKKDKKHNFSCFI